MKNANAKLIAFKRRLDNTLESAQRRTKEFSVRFENNPADALEWSQQIFSSAAELELCNSLLNFISEQACNTSGSPEQTLSIILDQLRRQTMRHVRHPEFSTSVASNLMYQMRGSAAAQMWEHLQMVVEFEGE